jgi:hypothetical protein
VPGLARLNVSILRYFICPFQGVYHQTTRVCLRDRVAVGNFRIVVCLRRDSGHEMVYEGTYGDKQTRQLKP